MFKKIPHSFNLNTLGPNVQTLSFTFFLPLLCFILELCTVQANKPYELLNIPTIKQEENKNKRYKEAPILQKTP